MPTARLTDRLIRSLKVEKGVIDFRDDRFRGFGVRVTARGTKTFFVIHPHGTGRKRRKLGRYPDTSLADARDEAEELVRKHKRAPHAVGNETFNDLADDFLRLHAEPQHSPRWLTEERRLIDKELRPILGPRKAAEITRRDLTDLLDPIAQRGPTTANRTRAVLSSIFTWAQGRDLLDQNPVTGLPKPAREQSRERVLTEPEIRAIWHASDAEGSPVARSLQLVLLTAQRGGEVRAMRWADIHGPWWTIPHTKNGRTHRVYLAPQSHAILDHLPRKHDHVFPAPRGTTPYLTTPYKAVNRIKAACGITDWSIHDLRRTAATTMATIGINPFVIEKVLGHTDRRGVTAIYDRSSYDNEKKDAMIRWGERVEQIVR